MQYFIMQDWTEKQEIVSFFYESQIENENTNYRKKSGGFFDLEAFYN